MYEDNTLYASINYNYRIKISRLQVIMGKHIKCMEVNA